jgi:hypothetical protein
MAQAGTSAQQSLFEQDDAVDTAFIVEFTPPLSLQLPNWPEAIRVLPNEVVRSALFRVANRNQVRSNLKNAEIATLGETVSITYTGEELRQDDELVWMHILHLVKKFKLDECVEFLPFKFLKDLEWPTNGGAAARLRVCLERMSVTGLTISSKRIGAAIQVSLIRKFQWRDDYTKTPYKAWKVWLEPEILGLFDPDYLTYCDWQTRKKLPVGIATKLHGYWASHKSPFPEGIENLMIVCGTQSPVKSFKQQLGDALKHLVSAGFLASWSISDNNKVSVKRV